MNFIFERVYNVYRGDDVKFNKFSPFYIKNTYGYWFTDNKQAAYFYGQYVRNFKITLNNPLIITDEQFLQAYPKGPTYFAKLAFNKGHDGVIIKNIMDGDTISTVYCVFNEKNIQFI